MKLARPLEMVRLYKNWPTAVVDRARLRRGSRVLYRLRGSRGVHVVAVIGEEDVRVINEMWIVEPYGVVTEIGGREIALLDIGANRGYFSVYLGTESRLKRIHAYEPSPANISILRANLELNELGDISVVHEAAVTPTQQSTVVLHRATLPGRNTTIGPESAAEVGIEAERYTGSSWVVPAVWAEDALRALVDEAEGLPILVKVDIEGSEPDVLRGFTTESLASVRWVVAELNAITDRAHDAVEHLRDAGFEAEIRESGLGGYVLARRER